MCWLFSLFLFFFFLFMQKTAYEMRISDWSSDVCSSDLLCANRKIVAIGQVQVPSGAKRIDARGTIVAPGFVDVGVFSADPHACAAGGITRVALMPDQSPVLDDPALVARATAARTPDLGGR